MTTASKATIVFPLPTSPCIKPIHRIERFHIVHDFFQDALLRRCRMKWQNRFHLLANSIRRFEAHSLERCALEPPQRKDQFQKEELFENQPAMIRRLPPIQLGEIVFRCGK